MSIIKFKDVWEMYRIKFIIDGKASWENFSALQGVNFSMEKGELLGIIGENGSGKSTILRLIAGMLKPDRGEVEVSGNVSGLLELGAGFQRELTGRENIFLQSELFGLRAEQVKERFQQIIDFAEIGKFIDAPVKCYSQGMFVRLAFAIAVHMDSDIFLVDDTLAVGDEYFQKKCIKEIFKIKQRGKSVIVVTHDMSMLQKLCARTIFLKQGMLIKDEETAKVVSFYSQTVGSPKGIAIIEKKQFNLVFNNGKLLLNWNGKLITPASGAYTSFGISDVWYNSSQAEWDVQESNGKLVATGRFYHLAMAQIWRIEVFDNYEIKWDIEIELEKDTQLPEMYVNIALVDGYKKWFADSEQGEFPVIKEEDRYCKSLSLKNNSSSCIGVYPQDSSFGQLPALLFEQSRLRYHSQAGILNSDYINPGRILQYKTIPSGNSSSQTSRCNCFVGKIIIDVPDINDYVSKAQKEFIISNGKLKLVFDNGRLSVLFDDIALTKADHMYSAFFIKQRWFTSDSAFWSLEKETDNKMVARGSWDNLGISQTWRINVCDDYSFTWDVDMEVNQEIDIEQQRLRCFFSEGFKLFFSELISEKFSDVFNDTDVDLLKRCVSSGEVGLQDPNGRLPVLSLSFSEKLGNFIKVFNSDYYSKARLLHLEKVESETNVIFSPGKYECFKTRFFLDKHKIIEVGNSDTIIENKNIKFVFNKGSGKFYKDAKEITKNIALYTSMRFNGRWYDSSSSARWKIVYKDGAKIIAVGKWLDLPLYQEWEVTVKDTGLFVWKVNLGIEDEIELDRLQANIMLSERFSQWRGGKDEGCFPEFRDDIDDDWDCLWCGKDDDWFISLKENLVHNLPEVSLSLLELNPQWRIKIINSDRYHRGRLLQYSSSLKTNFSPGKYPYFSGILTMQNK
jgi:ABC-type polysaccharide/polyol phosphate transport system ATPase subunit